MPSLVAIAAAALATAQEMTGYMARSAPRLRVSGRKLIFQLHPAERLPLVADLVDVRSAPRRSVTTMAISKLDAEGEAWEMRLSTGDLGSGGAPKKRTSMLGRIASVIRDGCTFVGYDGVLDPIADC